MEENHLNRMAAVPGKRGRPSNAELAARAEIVKVEIVEVELPRIAGIKCPGCGRGMFPRILRTNGSVRTCSCNLCGRMMRIEYDREGRASTAQLL